MNTSFFNIYLNPQPTAVTAHWRKAAARQVSTPAARARFPGDDTLYPIVTLPSAPVVQLVRADCPELTFGRSEKRLEPTMFLPGRKAYRDTKQIVEAVSLPEVWILLESLARIVHWHSRSTQPARS